MNALCWQFKLSRLIAILLILGGCLSACNTSPHIEHEQSSSEMAPETKSGDSATVPGASKTEESGLKKLLIEERGILGAGPRASIGIYTDQAKGGDVDAQTRLAVCYYTGQGTDENKGEAKNWFAKASEANDKKAQFCLAWLLEHGEGGPEDKRAAFLWYQIAAEGHEKFSELAQQEVNRLAPDFDNVEKERVRKEVLDWFNLSEQRKTRAEKTRRSY